MKDAAGAWPRSSSPEWPRRGGHLSKRARGGGQARALLRFVPSLQRECRPAADAAGTGIDVRWYSCASMRLFSRGAQEQQKKYAPGKIAILAAVVGLTPVLAFWLDWRLGLFIVGAYAALAFGAWRVSKRR